MRTNLFEKTSAEQAVKLLKEGNERFASGKLLTRCNISDTRASLAKNGQSPYAVILGCSDSRVPPEIIFDEGLGQLFVIRTAGNVEDHIVAGSVEYAVDHLGTRLIVVLGHEHCGAVSAVLEGGDTDDDLGTIVTEISSSLKKAKSRHIKNIASFCEDENVWHTISKLRENQIISKLIETDGLEIVGAKYHIESGKVIFF